MRSNLKREVMQLEGSVALGRPLDPPNLLLSLSLSIYIYTYIYIYIYNVYIYIRRISSLGGNLDCEVMQLECSVALGRPLDPPNLVESLGFGV